jgi:hypothetical protein
LPRSPTVWLAHVEGDLPDRISFEQKDQRVELFGKATYGEHWVVLSEDEFRHMGHIRDVAEVPGEQLERLRCRPLYGSWTNYDLPLLVHTGPPDDLPAARKAWERALTRKNQISSVRKTLRLLDRYGPGLERRSNDGHRFDPLERLRAGDDRAELERARDLYWHMVREQAEAQSAAYTAARAAPPIASPPVDEPKRPGGNMSEEDEWSASLKRVGTRILGNGILYVRCGLGRKGLAWGHPSPAGDCVRADEWRLLRETALATDHVSFTPGDLAGRMVGEAFRALVIEDPKVRACLGWLSLERPAFRPLLADGKFPALIRRQRSNYGPKHARPTHANVGYADLKEHWHGLPVGTLSNSVPDDPWPIVPQSAVLANSHPEAAAPDSSSVPMSDDKWPVRLDSSVLTEIFSGAYDASANYQDDPFEGPIYHAAKALADRHKAFFELLRGRRARLIAFGTNPNGSYVPIDNAQWDRADRFIDLADNDVFERNVGGAGRVLWSGVTLRAANGSAMDTVNVTPPDHTSVDEQNQLRRFLAADFEHRGIESLPWDEAIKLVDEGWLRKHRFLPPQVYIFAIRRVKAETGEEPPPPVTVVAATASSGTEDTTKRTAPRQQGKAGRPEAYDWTKLKKLLKDHVARHGCFESLEQLVNWCRENVGVRPGGRRPQDAGPDPKTLKSAISRHGLDKIGLRPVED